jgi:hypothetical protein
MSELEFLSVLLKTEFVYEIEGIGSNAEKTAKRLSDEGVISVEVGEGDERLVGLSDKERESGREGFGELVFWRDGRV